MCRLQLVAAEIKLQLQISSSRSLWCLLNCNICVLFRVKVQILINIHFTQTKYISEMFKYLVHSCVFCTQTAFSLLTGYQMCQKIVFPSM